MAVRLVGGEATSLLFVFITSLKYTAAFPYPDFNWIEGVNLDCLLCRTSILRKRKGNFTHSRRNHAGVAFKNSENLVFYISGTVYLASTNGSSHCLRWATSLQLVLVTG